MKSAGKYTRAVHALSLRTVAIELFALLSIVAAAFLELWHIMTSPGLKSIFFDNSDMLTLSLFNDSIKSGEKLDWVFSTQTFIFPEIPVSYIASHLTGNFKIALAINAIINILLLYVVLRFLSRQFTKTAAQSRLFSLLGCYLLTLFAVCEPATNLVASYFFMNTAYYGVIVGAIASLAICVYLFRKSFARNRNTYLALSGSFLLAFAISLSDALYVLQFVVPLTIVFFIAYVLNFASIKKLLYVIAPQFLGGLLGVLFSKIFLSSLLAPMATVSGYLHYTYIGESAGFFYHSAKEAFYSPSQRIELIIAIILFLVACAVCLSFIKQRTKSQQKPQFKDYLSIESFMVIGIGILTPLISLGGSIATGNSTLRYQIPFAVFPFIALLPLLCLPRVRSMLGEGRTYVALISLALVITLLALASNPPRTVSNIINFTPISSECVDTALKDTPYRHGVAGFSRARSIALNSRIGVDVIELNSDLAQFNWLHNRAKYIDYDADFIITERGVSNVVDISLPASSDALAKDNLPNIFLAASNVYACPGFDIYAFDRDNPARQILNQRLLINPDSR